MLAWVCDVCGHHNSKLRMSCRRCRTPRPLGALRCALRGRR